jgi:hypothetical protein
MIEEYARHLGHADLLRERIDGRVTCTAAVRRGNRVWKLRRMAATELDVLCRAGRGHW